MYRQRGIALFVYLLFVTLLSPIFLDPALAQDAGSHVVINEIMYHPASPAGEPENLGEEYIELYNRGSAAADLAGWRLSEGIDYRLPDVTLEAGGFLTVAADVNAFSALYPDVNNVVGGWEGHLSNRGELIRLLNDDGETEDKVRYADQGDWAQRSLGPEDRGHFGWIWLNDHDGGGHSLELENALLPNQYGQSWTASTTLGGTPGLPNSAATEKVAPYILKVKHWPTIPGSADTVTVNARIINDQAPCTFARLYYRIDRSSYDEDANDISYDSNDFTLVLMFDDGAHDDGEGDDGIYGAQVPAQADGTVVEFYIEAENASGFTRTWPAPCDVNDTAMQLANALYQVNDSFDPDAPWVAGSQPAYYLIMTERERAELDYIGSHSSDSRSNAQMNGSFIRVDGTDMDCRYRVGIRNRGAGSRVNSGGIHRNNYRINFPSDDPWEGVTAINIKNRYGYLQVLGDAVWRSAGLPSARTMAIQLQVNGENLALTNDHMYGSYVAVEVIDKDFATRQFPDDPRGNAYRCTNDDANLEYLGEDPGDYHISYHKQTNHSAADYQDLIDLTYALNQTPPEELVNTIEQHIHLEQWLRYLAVDALAGNLEGGLSQPKGDDYAMYRGMEDRRFWLIPHDLDTLFGRGDHSPDVDRDIHVYAQLDGFRTLLTHPDVLPLYYRQYLDLIATVFSPQRFDPLVEETLGGWVPGAMIESIKRHTRQRNTEVLAQIPRDLTVEYDLPLVEGLPYSTSERVGLFGQADVTRVRSVLVNGRLADWSPVSGLWEYGGSSACTDVLVPAGAEWRYVDDGTDLGTDWRDLNYDDGTWSSGAAELGYGDGDEVTEVSYGPDSEDKYITTYFRHSFDVVDPGAFVGLCLQLLRDDGAIVYLNGSEVVRSNMPEGDIDANTPADDFSSGFSERSFHDFPLPTDLLRTGTNVLAVEVHQGSRTSSDMSFNLALGAQSVSAEGCELRPGVNRLLVQAFDGPEGMGKEVQTGTIDIWYDTGFLNTYPKQVTPDPVESTPDIPNELMAKMIVRDSYLPGVPVLVRVELQHADGRVAREQWDATARLSTDSAEVQLSTNRVTLYNGLGSALVTVTGQGDFSLTADVTGLQVTTALQDWSDEPVTEVSGGLDQSETWSGIYHITGGDFDIPEGVTLTLEPGTLVLIDGVATGTDGIDIDVAGAIQSLGTAGAPVTLTAAQVGENWGELHHDDATPSTFQYTHITRAGSSPRTGHSQSGPTIRAGGSTFIFDHACLTDNAGKLMHVTSGCDLTFRHCIFARSIMGPEITGTALLFADSWITDMHSHDDADGIYIHGQQSGQRCELLRSVVANLDDDGIDTLGSEVTIEDVIVRNCKDKGISVYNGETTIRRCLVVENNQAPEDPTVASIAAKATGGAHTVVNIDHTTIVSTKTDGVVDIGIQSHNKYGVTSGSITYNVTNSIIDATNPVDVQEPYLESDIHIDHSTVYDEEWPGTGNLNGNPRFVDPLHHDYRLSLESPCLGAASGAGPWVDQGYYQDGQPSVDYPDQPDLNASLAEDTTWTAYDGPYHIAGELTIPVGVTLTVEAGSSVFFDAGAQMTVKGRLLAQGTADTLIRFTRTPGSTGPWEGLQFNGTLEDNRIEYAAIDYGITNKGMVGVQDSTLLLDHVWLENTDLWRIRTVNSNLAVRHCVFSDIFGLNEPPSTDNRSEHIWGSGVPADGWFVIENNTFGTTKGHNDAIDFDGGARPDAIPLIRNNLFMGGGDDALDIEVDAHIEGNVFMNYRKDRYNTTPRESNVLSAGRDRHYVVVRNTFINNEHVAQIKTGAYMTFVNNTVIQGQAAAFFFELPGQTSSPGKGIYVDSCIFWDSPHPLFDNVLVDDPRYGSTEIVMHRSICPAEWHSLGQDNIDADPLFMKGDPGYRLQPISPAHGTGINGRDRGAAIPAGISISGEPKARTHRRESTLWLDGPGMTHYQYSTTGPLGPWSDEIPVDTPIVLNGLNNGQTYQVYAIGLDSAAHWQEKPTASDIWTVDRSHRRLVINELLANNQSVMAADGSFPDLIELYYDGADAFDLSGTLITARSDPSDPFIFPPNTIIRPGEFLVLLADRGFGGKGIHLGFTLNKEGDAVYLYGRNGLLIDSVNYGMQIPDLSIGRYGSNDTWSLTVPTLGQANIPHPLGNRDSLRINEWLAAASVLLEDDFIELYSPHPLPVNMGGLYLTDNPIAETNRHLLPPLSFVPAHGYVTFIADRQHRPGHVDFSLAAEGETLALQADPYRVIDSVTYRPQTLDISQGRSPDGSPFWNFFALPTPGVDNPARYMDSVELVPMEQTWAYEQSGDLLPENWNQVEYDDSSWPSGPALLYVEGSTLNAPKNTPLELGLIAYYFRARFQLAADPQALSLLELTPVIDDGAIVYLNGAEILRLRMPEGPVDPNTLSSSSVGNANFEGPFAIDPELLVKGENLLAVEVHQSSSGSSDVVCGMSMQATVLQNTAQDAYDQALALLDGLRITELMYHADDGSDGDYIELQNIGGIPLDLEGVRFTDGITFIFPPMLLAPGEYVIVAADVEIFQAEYGAQTPVAGAFSGKLSNNGESIALTLPHPFNAAILRFDYSDRWYESSDGAGDSLTIADPLMPIDMWDEAHGWYNTSPSPGD